MRRDHHLYETDWLKARAGRRTGLDVVNIAEELDDMAAHERSEVENRLIVLLMYLLEYEHQPDLRSGSWRGSIVEQRRGIRKALQHSPSLKPYLQQLFDGDCYEDAVGQAIAETGLERGQLPTQCGYDLAQVLDPAFWPGKGPHPVLARG